ncbi:iron chelate uptake ABC transporter family permease subunit [Agromyces luteolus]|uniref:Iron chelate uptake ABC transporter family permease subunit n=1 Tax=Agromyces luteolus TaxID=88373 RepID=A0A7C9HFN1_9MICO|nr:iron chelate uptake ABC transporter family permease subunit [Agromyces luteolus]
MSAVALRAAPPSRGAARLLAPAAVGVALLAVASTFVGVADVSPSALLAQGSDGEAARLLVASRIPRTVSLVLAGASLAIVGLIMQMLVRNRFVEPSTTGTAESAALGLLVVTLLAPGMPLIGKMGVAAVFALAGTGLFLLILRRIPVRQIVLVPLVGIMLGGVIGAVTTFIAYRYDLLQTLGTWMTGDFSGILRGRYELLWIAFVLTVLAWVAADRFTVAGLGRDVATNLGLHHGRVLAGGLAIVAVITATVVVTAGVIPFLGLVVPNVVSMVIGDDVRRGIPWVAVLGAGFVVACDLVGRLIRFPYEIPLGIVVGVVGAALFLWLLLRKGSRAH